MTPFCGSRLAQKAVTLLRMAQSVTCSNKGQLNKIWGELLLRT